MDIQVIFEDSKVETYSISPTSSFLCELKRRIYEKTGLIPIHQRLQLEGSTDNFSIPVAIRCAKRKREPSKTIEIKGYNDDFYKIDIDPLDTVLDLKFLLGNFLSEKAEHFRLTANGKTYPDNTEIKSTSFLEDHAKLRYWLEYPSNQKGHGTVHRTIPVLIKPEIDYLTIPNLLHKQHKIKPNIKHFGVRKWKEDGTRGDYVWHTLDDINKRINNIAAGFRQLNLEPHNTRLGICSINRMEWPLCDYAGHTQSFITVPLYDTFGPDAIEYIINHAEVQIVCCDKNTLNSIVIASKKCPTLKYIVLMDDEVPDKDFANKNASAGFTHRLSQIEKNGAKFPTQHVLPKPTDLASICYTSGTTGNPKGVMLTHENLMSTVNSAYLRLLHTMKESNDEVIISYLPLAHIYERIVELVGLRFGARIGYFSGKVENLVDDIQVLKPTFFAGVPRVYQKMQDRVFSQVNSSNFIRKFLFNQAYKAKASALEQGLKPPQLWERLVFSKVKDRFGGKIKGSLSGSAPLSSATATFIQVCVSDLLGEGYGLTETSAGGTGTEHGETSFGHVGTPVTCTEIKLVDVADRNYLTTDKPEPRGEIWIRGYCVFQGYYKLPEQTDEVLTKDGWFATGDIGKWRSDGQLQIIDRKKNIFKLAQGEYIRPEFIENVYKQSSYIANIYVHGDSTETYLIAIIVPDFEVLIPWARNNGLSDIANDRQKLIQNPNVINLIRMDIEKLGNQEKLAGFEKVKRFKLVIDDFTIENGLLTTTMKLKRHEAKLKYENEIKLLYTQVADSKL